MENPETTAVSGFCYAIFQGAIQKISFPKNALWEGLELNSAVILAVNENSTLWEDFYIFGTKNHAWSGCPLEIAFKYILGLKTEDAFKTYTISPVQDIFKEIRCTFKVGDEIVKKHITFDEQSDLCQ